MSEHVKLEANDGHELDAGVNAAVGYYGGRIAKFADEHPKAPIMLHFGKLYGRAS
jgi:dienelactone hydrolase